MISTIAAAISAVVGVALMALPSVMGFDDPLRSTFQVIGPIATSLGVIALWDIVRAVLRANVVVGGALALAAALPAPADARIVAIAAGVVLVATGLTPMRLRDRYAGGWTSLWADR